MIEGIIVTDGERDAFNAGAHMNGIDPDGKMNTLSAALVPSSGEEDIEATHWGARGVINLMGRGWVENESGAMWWRWDATTRELLASWDGLHLGEVWGWSACLSAAGLKPRRVMVP